MPIKSLFSFARQAQISQFRVILEKKLILPAAAVVCRIEVLTIASTTFWSGNARGQSGVGGVDDESSYREATNPWTQRTAQAGPLGQATNRFDEEMK